MSITLPNIDQFMSWSWDQIELYYLELQTRPISAHTVHAWLSDWTHLSELLDETEARLYIASTLDTTNQAAERRYHAFLEELQPSVKAADQVLKEKLLLSGVQSEGFELPLRNMRAEADLFREDNLPLLSEEKKLASEYNRVIGAQTVEWEGQEKTLRQLLPVYQESDRAVRERAWHLAAQRQLADRETINELWVKFMELRRQVATNANLPDYRAYRWAQLLRFDYAPEDCFRFHQAIEEVVVPAAQRAYERRRQRLGVNRLRPWDLYVDPLGRPPLRPFQEASQLESKTAAIFQRLDPQLGEYFETMRRENLIDLPNRKGKAPGAYCYALLASKRAFIFHNAVGLHEDVQTMLHEAGHAFHAFESSHLPYFQQRRQIPIEFSEVASMAVELLAAPYLEESHGGFYTPAEAARARIEHLEENLLFWPYMAVVDAFQHWAYENYIAASEPANCDAIWVELWDRFMKGVDWAALESVKETGWQRKEHIHDEPFYYVEYGMAQMGAFQVWKNALVNQVKAVADYRRALSLGGTVTLPELYREAGARFAFDARTLKAVVQLIEDTIEMLENARGDHIS
ncbi:MAG: M3 family oligoendopeptidase [Anaerolineales bacterium]